MEEGVFVGVCGALGDMDAETVCVRVCVSVPVAVCVDVAVLEAVCVPERVCVGLCVEDMVIVFEIVGVVVSLAD